MKWIAIGFFVFLVVLVFIADQGQIPLVVRRLYRFPGGDKVGHFVLMGLLAFFVSMALPVRRLLLGNLAIVLVVTIEELSQAAFSTRTLSWADWLSSCAGVVCFAWAARWLRLRRDRGTR
jgi:polysaccharide biosynthesis protein VpsQ